MIRIEPPVNLKNKSLFPQVAWVAMLLMVASFAIAALTSYFESERRQLIGTIVVALWAAGPPVWFWLEWSVFSAKLSDGDKDDLKRSHELARDMWIAIVVGLALSFGITPFC